MAIDEHTRGLHGEPTNIAGEPVTSEPAGDDAANLREKISELEELLSILSHDLRNPLAAIRLATAVLARPGQPQEARNRTVERIGSNTDRMLRILEDLADFSHLSEHPAPPLELKRCDLEPICRAAIASVAASYPRRKVSLSSPGQVLGAFDAARLSRAIASLLTSVVEHGSADDHTRVVITQNPHLVVLIENPLLQELEPELGRLLDPEQPITLRRSAGARHKASDLGLYVARHVIAAHGGKVCLKTPPGAEPHFAIYLSREPSAR